jgi:hypothetical protein
LHNDEFHSLYSSFNVVTVTKSRRMKWVRHVAYMGEGRGVYRGPKGRDHWEDVGIGGRITFKMDLREIGINGVNWIWLAQDRVHWQTFINTVMNLQVPQGK